MKQYSTLSYYYDELNKDCPYDKYVDFICKNALNHGIKEGRLLDCGCGTGNISVLLAKKGYDLTAFDVSDDALCVAEQNARNNSVKIRFLRADMRSFKMSEEYDMAISTFDSVNYLTLKSELRSFFDCAVSSLKKGGIMIFDVNTSYRYESVYADNCYVLESDRAFLTWQNFYNEKSKRCKFYLTLFELKKSGVWERFDEEHTQKYHSSQTLEDIITEAGFELCGVYGDYDMGPLTSDCEKAYYVLKKL